MAKQGRLLRIVMAGGGFTMCRQNRLLAFGLIGLGLGMLLSLLLQGTFLTFLLAAVFVAVGVLLLNK